MNSVPLFQGFLSEDPKASPCQQIRNVYVLITTSNKTFSYWLYEQTEDNTASPCKQESYREGQNRRDQRKDHNDYMIFNIVYTILFGESTKPNRNVENCLARSETLANNRSNYIEIML